MSCTASEHHRLPHHIIPTQALTCLLLHPQLPEALPAALHSWQHPGSSFSGEAVAELQAAAAGKQLLQQRLAAWRRSLRSLYYQLRHGGCQAFYVVAQQVRPGSAGRNTE